MRSRYKVHEPDGVYFITNTIVEWIPVFITRDAFEIITRSLAHCRAHKNMRLYAYVVLENHMHMIAGAPKLSEVMQAFKSFTAREILRYAQSTGRDWLLNRFAYYKRMHKVESDYQVWQEGFHPQKIDSDAMMQQKIHYIHENPVRRGYVDAPEEWRYSSARNYVRDDHRMLEIDEMPL
ncbi:MAG: transposase [Candidatus Hydrogenedentes bacterium]|nr:transposase [Candidatus Hydrogenedentota bacterium]